MNTTNEHDLAAVRAERDGLRAALEAVKEADIAGFTERGFLLPQALRNRIQTLLAASASQAAQQEAGQARELPPLPESFVSVNVEGFHRAYSAEQMHEYARAALVQVAPAVAGQVREQPDERDTFEREMRKRYGKEHFEKVADCYGEVCYNSSALNGALNGWKARAALAQTAPAVRLVEQVRNIQHMIDAEESMQVKCALQDELDAAQALLAPAVPEGCVIVPKKPTVAMLEAGSMGIMANTIAGCCYRAMLAAAPSASEKLTLENAPVGTKAPSINGGHWSRTDSGWKWCTGSTFPRPGGDWNGELIAPSAPADQPQEKK